MKRLLIADKSAVLTCALRKRLHGKFEIHTCCDGDTAMALLDSLRPDILFLDWVLPDVSGLTILKCADFVPAVCIARTNYISDEVVLAAQSAGVTHMFLVPLHLETVVQCILEYQ